MNLQFIDLTTTDPAFNLAAEEYVFEKLPRDSMYVMLWQNDNAIIVGKHQNTLAQINESYVREKGIRVVRRLSGGGAVYHDLGNLNYTVIADGDGTLNFGRFCGIVLDALARVGVKGERNGRNDMTIDGKKFSGNAQYAKQGRVMHHGTILFDSDGLSATGPSCCMLMPRRLYPKLPWCCVKRTAVRILPWDLSSCAEILILLSPVLKLPLWVRAAQWKFCTPVT